MSNQTNLKKCEHCGKQVNELNNLNGRKLCLECVTYDTCDFCRLQWPRDQVNPTEDHDYLCPKCNKEQEDRKGVTNESKKQKLEAVITSIEDTIKELKENRHGRAEWIEQVQNQLDSFVMMRIEAKNKLICLTLDEVD